MERSKNNVIVFDSGVGGLNILYECVKRVWWVNYYYISDSENVPYGNRSKNEILNLTLNALKVAKKLKPIAIIIACNTVTANCIEELRRVFSCPIIGVQPAIKPAVEVGGECVVLATNATVKSQRFQNLLSKYANYKVRAVACEGLAKFIEDNIFNLPQALPCGLLPSIKCDCLVLGCTHYSFLRGEISEYYGCVVFDGNCGVADHFSKIVGMIDHRTPLLGKNDHFTNNMLNVTFLGKNNDKNSQIFNLLNKNNCSNM